MENEKLIELMEDMKKAIELAPENGANISGEYNNFEQQKNIPF